MNLGFESIHQTLVPPYIRDLVVYQAGKPIEEVVEELGLKRVTKLASNENPLGPSPYAIKEMTKGLWDVHRYPDMNATKLKRTIAELYDLKIGNIVLGNGSEGIMAHIARTFLSTGHEVLTSENTFIGFTILARSVGAKIQTVPLTSDFRFDVEALAKAITPKTKVIYIANPNNPTGTYISKQEFDYLMDHVANHILVILDEAYFEYARTKDDYPDSMDYRYDNVLTLRTFSKAYGLSGVRAGYGFGHEDLISNLLKVKLTFEPNYIAQLGAIGALFDQPHLERTIENNLIQYDRTLEYLREKGFNPIESICNFIAFKTGDGKASDYLFELLLKQGVIIRPLKANEMPEFVRVSLGSDEEMDHFFEAMDEVLPKYVKKFPKGIQ